MYKFNTLRNSKKINISDKCIQAVNRFMTIKDTRFFEKEFKWLIATFQILERVPAYSVAISAFNYPTKHLFLLNTCTTTEHDIVNESCSIIRII